MKSVTDQDIRECKRSIIAKQTQEDTKYFARIFDEWYQSCYKQGDWSHIFIWRRHKQWWTQQKFSSMKSGSKMAIVVFWAITTNCMWLSWCGTCICKAKEGLLLTFSNSLTSLNSEGVCMVKWNGWKHLAKALKNSRKKRMKHFRKWSCWWIKFHKLY